MVYQHRTVADFALDAVALPTSWILRAIHGYSDRSTRKQRPRETLREIRSASEALLPGAVIRRLLLFRYFLIWRKPVAGTHIIARASHPLEPTSAIAPSGARASSPTLRVGCGWAMPRLSPTDAGSGNPESLELTPIGLTL